MTTTPDATWTRTAGPVTTVLPVVTADATAETLAGDQVSYANFDHAASTPALVAVDRAVRAASAAYASVHRGKGRLSQVSSHWYEAAREEVARFVGARPSDHVIFTRNTTDAFALLAKALPADATVFVFDSEHHATLLPWRPEQTVRLAIPRSVEAAVETLDRALSDRAAACPVVVLTGASNVTGEYWPVASLAETARRHGARIALDAAQLAPHAALDLASLGVDYLAFSGHKLYAPYGVGVLVGRADWLDAAEPYLAGGGATAAVTEDGIRWHVGPARHEAGSPNVIGAVALAAACATLRANRRALIDHERHLGDLLTAGLRGIDGVQTYSVFGPDHDRAAVVTFTIDGLPSGLVAAALSAEWGIGVRDGKFCAHLLTDTLLADRTETTAVRVSAGLGTTDEHVRRLLEAVRALATDGPAWTYAEVPGQGWVPQNDPRDLTIALPW